MVDLEAIRQKVIGELPEWVSWELLLQRWNLIFRGAREPLRAVCEEDITGDIDEEWRHFYIFGEQDIAHGGGSQSYLVIFGETGEVALFDVERHLQVMKLNSSIDKFIAVFRAYHTAVRTEHIVAEELEAELERLDPNADGTNDWLGLAEYLESGKRAEEGEAAGCDRSLDELIAQFSGLPDALVGEGPASIRRAGKAGGKLGSIFEVLSVSAGQEGICAACGNVCGNSADAGYGAWAGAVSGIFRGGKFFGGGGIGGRRRVFCVCAGVGARQVAQAAGEPG